jgi:hypothetical protein
VYPDFIGIGAQKAGTTWLSHNLQLHPQIWMPRIKEIHYFDEKVHEPMNVVVRLSKRLFSRRVVDRRWRRQVKTRTKWHLKKFSRERFLWDLKYYASTPSDEWYASLFELGRGSVIGEITPAYSFLEPNVIAHVREIMPQAKLIFMMRNPIERAWSQAVMQFSKVGNRDIGAIAERTLRHSFERKGSKVRTDYLRTLENWGSFYPEEQIFVGFLEDVHFFPKELLRSLYAFLGVDPSFEPPGVNRKVHSRSASRIPTRLAIYLARRYRDEITHLSERFGGYTSFWLHCAERLADDPPAEEFISYPFWESFLWQEWSNESEDLLMPGFQEVKPRSGVLSSVQASTETG